MSIFKGLSAFPITPCDEAGALLTADLEALIKRLDESDVQSVGLLGSTGTYAYHPREIRREATTIARASLARKPLIVGVGALRTDDAVAYAKDAAAAGADGLLLAPVSYTPLHDDEVFTHFSTVAKMTDLPLCIYNNPGTTHFTFSTDLLARISGLETVKAIKMPLPADTDEIAGLRAALPDDITLGYSGDWGCADCMLAGAEAWFSVIAGYMPQETAKLAEAAARGDSETVKRLNTKFAPLWDLFQKWGSLRVIYAAANDEGVSTGKLPKPLLPIPDAVLPNLRDALAMARS